MGGDEKVGGQAKSKDMKDCGNGFFFFLMKMINFYENKIKMGHSRIQFLDENERKFKNKKNGHFFPVCLL